IAPFSVVPRAFAQDYKPGKLGYTAALSAVAHAVVTALPDEPEFFSYYHVPGAKADMSSVEERVKKIVAEQLGVKEEEVKNSAAFVEDLGADSLDTVELVMALEE